MIDDLGYLPQGVDASEVMFTLVAERYERFSQCSPRTWCSHSWCTLQPKTVRAVRCDRLTSDLWASIRSRQKFGNTIR